MLLRTALKRPAAFFALLMGILITLAAWDYSSEAIHEKAQHQFEEQSTLIANRVRERMSAYRQVLRGAQALFYASNEVDRSEWNKYISALNLDERYPGILGVGFSVQVQPNELEAHTAQLRSEGFQAPGTACNLQLNRRFEG